MAANNLLPDMGYPEKRARGPNQINDPTLHDLSGWPALDLKQSARACLLTHPAHFFFFLIVPNSKSTTLTLALLPNNVLLQAF